MRFTAEREERLDVFVSRMLPGYSRTKLAAWISSGMVTADGVPEKPRFRLRPGMVVELEEPPERSEAHDLAPADIRIDIVFEDEHMLVVNKPRGLATHPAPSLKEPSLVNALLARGQSLSSAGGSFRPGIVHRLDKATTGLLVVAKSDSVHAALARQFERKTARRTYIAVVEGDLGRDRLTIDAPIGRDPKNRQRMAVVAGGKPAVTQVARLDRIPEGTVVEARLETGRTHQIRVHLAWIKHPVLGDALYAPKRLHSYPAQLHAWKLSFVHPVSGSVLETTAHPPEDFLWHERTSSTTS